jgi:hypothetical protein
MVQEPEGSSPHSQQLANYPYPEPVESNPHPPASLPKIHSDPILPPTPWSSKWSLSFGLSHQNLVHFSLLTHACSMSRQPHSPWLDLPSDIWEWVQVRHCATSSILLSFHPSFVQIFFSHPLFSNTLSLCSSLSVRDQVSHPYKTTGIIMVVGSQNC